MATEADSRLYPAFVWPETLNMMLENGAEETGEDFELRELLQFLGKCDGRRSLASVMKTFDDRQKAKLLESVSAFIASEAIIDGRALYRISHEWSKNPPSAPPAFSEADVEGWPRFRPSNLGEPIAHLPKSSNELECENGFSRLSATLADMRGEADEASLRDNLIECARRAYAIGPRTRSVASAGALYPVVLFLAFPTVGRNECYTFSWLDPFSGVCFRIGEHSVADLLPAFPPDTLVQRSLRSGIGLLFICCDTTRTCAKYGNRGYRFALLEAGAVWQNIDLAASQRNIPIRAFGGFCDDKCKELLALPQNIYPMLTAFMGN